MVRRRMVLCCAALALSTWCSAQKLIVRGSVHCKPEGKSEYVRPLGEECVLVVPLQYPEYSTLVGEDGVFDVVFPYQKRFLDQLCYIGFRAGGREVGTARIFLTSAGLVREGENWVFEVPEPVMLQLPCDSLRQGLSGARVELDSLRETGHTAMPGWVLIGGGIGALVGAVGMLVSSGGAGAPGGGSAPPDTMIVTEVGTESFERSEPPLSKSILFYQTVYSPSPGQTFAPARGCEGPLSANVSALGFSRFPQVEVLMDFAGFFDIAGFIPIGNQLGSKLEIALFSQNEEGITLLETGEQVPVSPEASAFLAVASLTWGLTDGAALGLSGRYLKEKTQRVDGFRIDSAFYSNRPVGTSRQPLTTEVQSAGFDLDLSGIVQILPELRVGATVMNVLGLEILQADGSSVSMRSYGAGATFRNAGIVVGADVQVSESSEPFVTGGATLIVTNEVRVSAGGGNRYRHLQAGVSLTNLLPSIGSDLSVMYCRSDLAESSIIAGISLSF